MSKDPSLSTGMSRICDCWLSLIPGEYWGLLDNHETSTRQNETNMVMNKQLKNYSYLSTVKNETTSTAILSLNDAVIFERKATTKGFDLIWSRVTEFEPSDWLEFWISSLSFSPIKFRSTSSVHFALRSQDTTSKTVFTKCTWRVLFEKRFYWFKNGQFLVERFDDDSPWQAKLILFLRKYHEGQTERVESIHVHTQKL